MTAPAARHAALVREIEFFFFQAEDGIRDFCLSRGLGDVYKRQATLEARFDRLAGGTRPVVRAIERALTSRRPRARYVAPKKFALLAAALLHDGSWIVRTRLTTRD